MNNLQKTQQGLQQHGFSFIPVRIPDKTPALKSWAEYQTKRPNGEAKGWFEDAASTGVAVVCGPISGNLVAIDFDAKIPNIKEAYEKVCANKEIKEILEKCYHEATLSGGYHILFRVQSDVAVRGNEKLARTKDNMCWLETRGKGGYLVIAPTKGYSVIKGKLSALPVLTQEEYDLLMEVLRSYNQFHEPVKAMDNSSNTGKKNWEEFNYQGLNIVLPELEKNGWIITKQSDTMIHLRRPEKKRGTSAALIDTPHGWFFHVFTTSTVFQPEKNYSLFQVYTLLEFNGDYKEAAKSLYNRGVVEKGGRLNPAMKAQVVKLPMQLQGDVTEGALPTEEEAVPFGPSFFVTHFVNNAGDEVFNVDYRVMVEQFEKWGYRKYVYDTDYTIIKVSDNIAREVQVHNLIDEVKGYVTKELGDDNILGFIIKKSKEMFDFGKFAFLKLQEDDFLKDTSETAYMPFKNVVVAIHKDRTKDIEFFDYSELAKPIWDTDIIQREIDVDKWAEHYNPNQPGGMFAKFLRNVMSNDDKRVQDLMRAMGYLLFGLKEPSAAKAIILMDQRIPDSDDQANGGTGKSLVAKFVSEYRRTVILSGKTIDHRTPFFYQDVNLNTRVILLDDIRKNFSFDYLFAEVTGPLKVEKKNKAPFIIPFDRAPKFVLTTNHTVKGTGTSYDRRKVELEFSPYYNEIRTPRDEFGCDFFTEWSIEEWGYADMFAAACLDIFLQHGLPNTTEFRGNSNLRKAIDMTSHEFLTFMVEKIESGFIQNNVMFNRKDLYTSFIESTPEAADLKFHTFTKWVTRFADALKLKIKHRQSGFDRFTRFNGELNKIVVSFREAEKTEQQ